MLVSVVVPTYRRPELLARCLGALGEQELDPSAFEVMIADDAGSDETRRQVEAIAARSRPAIRYTGRPGPTAAAARNVGWRAARGPIIAFTDDDCIPDPRWLPRAEAAFEGDVAAVSGRVVVPIPGVPTDYQRDTAGLEGAEFVTANCFCAVRCSRPSAASTRVRRRLAGGQRPPVLPAEAGHPIRRAPGAIVVHPAGRHVGASASGSSAGASTTPCCSRSHRASTGCGSSRRHP